MRGEVVDFVVCVDAGCDVLLERIPARYITCVYSVVAAFGVGGAVEGYCSAGGHDEVLDVLQGEVAGIWLEDGREAEGEGARGEAEDVALCGEAGCCGGVEGREEIACVGVGGGC